MLWSAEKKDSSDLKARFRSDIIAGLMRPRKRLQPKHFYDRAGSMLFNRICDLPEYYLTRVEMRLLPGAAREIAPRLCGEYALIEFGAGSLQKVEHLLRQLDCIRCFKPVDISGEHLHLACAELAGRFPHVRVEPVVADFSQALDLATGALRRFGFFPGSTIGNFSPRQAQRVLRHFGKLLGRNAWLLIGVDTKKNPALLHAAYNDADGVTAAFNRNIIARINHEFGVRIDIDSFDHYAFYHPSKGCIEMHLLSREAQVVVLDGAVIEFREGESIHTESSYKYTPLEFAALARGAGWSVEDSWCDSDTLFGLYLLKQGRA